METTNEILKEAVATRFSECYGAMSMANAIAGQHTPKWELLHSYTGIEIIEECKRRGIDYKNIRVVIPDTDLVKDTMAFKLLYPIATNQPKYRFTEDEENKLLAVLRDMAGDIEKVAGLTFNQALLNVVKPKK